MHEITTLTVCGLNIRSITSVFTKSYDNWSIKELSSFIVSLFGPVGKNNLVSPPSTHISGTFLRSRHEWYNCHVTGWRQQVLYYWIVTCWHRNGLLFYRVSSVTFIQLRKLRHQWCLSDGIFPELGGCLIECAAHSAAKLAVMLTISRLFLRWFSCKANNVCRL